MANATPTWTLEELGEEVASALSVDYPGPANGQVRAVPDARTIRYYRSLGLLAPPAATRGRTALYGRRHLMQLIAIKRLQAAGCSLQEVQAKLLGTDDAELARLARLPEAAEPPAPAQQPRRQAFWRERPRAKAVTSEPEPTSIQSPVEKEEERASPLMLLPLEGLASLLLPAARLGAEERARIRAAAGPLLEELRACGLLVFDPERNRKR